MNNEELNLYYETFGDFPPALITVSYDDEKYKKIMKEAVEKNEPITAELLDEVFNEVDLVENEEKEGENDMEEAKIRRLLKEYGAEDREIENFMDDLANFKEDIEEEQKEVQPPKKENPLDEEDEAENGTGIPFDDEDEEEYILNAHNLELLKKTEEGKNLIMHAPEMEKSKLKSAILDYLSKNK